MPNSIRTAPWAAAASVFTSVCACICAGPALAADATEEAYGVHGQATYVWQTKPAFSSAYDGPNSLQAAREKSYSFTATAAAGGRLWRGGEAYLNGELVQGVPLSGLTGLGGLSNGELQKTAGSHPVLYRARAFLRQSWALDGGSETLAPGFNQLGGQQARRRVVLSVGNLAVSDLFDNNRYAHDARTQFLNWALLTHGHFDFAADSRGYTQGAALEWITPDWALRGGRFAVPVESNGLALDNHFGKHHGDQLEFEHHHQLAGREGALRLLFFRNVARMANFDEALALAAASGTVPDLAPARRLQSKSGWGVAAEQALSADLGGFVRLGRHDGKTEPYSFAAIDEHGSVGFVWHGTGWGRAEDQLGLAFARNGLSTPHRRFLAAGGSDFFLGDGRLRYGAERILEASYSAALTPLVRLSLNLQHINNPGYNRDRGPVQLVALRMHVER